MGAALCVNMVGIKRNIIVYYVVSSIIIRCKLRHLRKISSLESYRSETGETIKSVFNNYSDIQ